MIGRLLHGDSQAQGTGGGSLFGAGATSASVGQGGGPEEHGESDVRTSDAMVQFRGPYEMDMRKRMFQLLTGRGENWWDKHRSSALARM
jgi:hypothetical protein